MHYHTNDNANNSEKKRSNPKTDNEEAELMANLENSPEQRLAEMTINEVQEQHRKCVTEKHRGQMKSKSSG